ncbi:MAG TPA: hypothetical protein VE775_05790 [Pyrinomonadaceae bacterium]|nr:hypothetical protein [Pyrinomonadaceae bacterium]
MYRPNFCAECGARIERTRWRWWTSRRFCPTCARQFRRARITRPLSASLLLLALGFGTGRALRPAPPPLVVASGAQPASVQLANAVATQTAHAYGADGTAAERPTDPDEIVSVCGARTKKGTPCQRRVRGTGRCWQHLGKPAMLPPEKLLVQGHLPAAESRDDKP